ncbi:pseudouridine synthase, partial [Ascobolus immersus RN42]
MLRTFQQQFTRAIRTMATPPPTTAAAAADSTRRSPSPSAPKITRTDKSDAPSPSVQPEQQDVKFSLSETTKATTPPPTSPKAERAPSPEKELHLQGLFAVNKPSGITSFDVIRQLRNCMNTAPMFQPLLLHERSLRLGDVNSQRSRKAKHNKLELKMGHGGTLDPMANGVLVLGVGTGTKQLQNFLMGTKEYVAKAIFGAETDTYDAEGSIVHKSPYGHVTREKVEEVLGQFRGEIQQIPPIYSALRHNGVRFYEYARRGEKPPVEIQPRPVTCSHLELLDYTTEHDFKYPNKFLQAEEKENAEIVLKATDEHGKPVTTTEKPAETTTPAAEKTPATITADTPKESSPTSESTQFDPSSPPPVITIKMAVSSGFYVRSLIHDIGVALGTSAHMVTLTRTRQSQYEL